jgi:ubiquinone/menaquinone biosynthesis C-methylase UbiE
MTRQALNEPIFCLTSDLDWASDFAVSDLLQLVGSYGITPTVFATHASCAIRESHANGAIELGIHPNFLPGSTHGSDYLAVIDHLTDTFPEAQSFRSHCFVDGTHITREMVRRGFRYDSNVCLYLQPDLAPLNHESGLVRFPVFWEDDTHWRNSEGDWTLERYLPALLSPGLKILNVHPFNVASNIPDQDYYARVHDHITTLGPQTIEEVRYEGKGTRTFLISLLELLRARGQRFFTLGELFRTFPISGFLAALEDASGRTSAHSDDEYRRYWSASDTERQEFVRLSYGQRAAKDIYATSRDSNVRELEIDALRSQLAEKGKIIDLGCGNGYTLLSVASGLDDWEMVGVDFSDVLIKGAVGLLEERRDQLASYPEFVCADAIGYIRQCDTESARYIITERFLLNLPSPQVQKEVIREAYRILAPGGRLLMCEGSDDGFAGLNAVRDCAGLDAVPATSKDNITSIRFKDAEIEQFVQEEVGFRLRAKVGFSSYFLMTRVLHPLLVAPLNPRFDARINEIAAKIQRCVPSLPGLGANTLWVLEKPGF